MDRVFVWWDIQIRTFLKMGIYCYLVSVHSILLLSEVKVNDGEKALTHDPLLKTLTKMLRNIRTKKIQRRDDFLTILEANKPATINEKILKNFRNYSNLRDVVKSTNLEGLINNGNLSTYGMPSFAVIHVSKEE